MKSIGSIENPDVRGCTVRELKLLAQHARDAELAGRCAAELQRRDTHARERKRSGPSGAAYRCDDCRDWELRCDACRQRRADARALAKTRQSDG